MINRRLGLIPASGSLFLALAALLPAQMPDVAQVLDYRETTKRPLFPGATEGTYSFPTRRGTASMAMVTVELAARNLATDLLIPEEGVLQKDELEDIGRNASAAALIGLESAPGVSEMRWAGGLRYGKGRLYSWPSSGNHLIIRPEGAAFFARPINLPATASDDRGTSVTIVSLNGPMPTARGQASVYTGALKASDLFGLDVPPDAIAIPIVPDYPRLDSYQALAAGDRARRLWRTAKSQPLSATVLKPGEAVLVLTGADLPLARRWEVKDQLVEIAFNLPPEVIESRLVMPVGDPLMQDGKRIDPDGARNVVNAVAIDGTGTRLLVITAPEFERRGLAMPLDQFVEFAGKEGYSEAVALQPTTPLVVTNYSRRSQQRDASLGMTRLALGIRLGEERVSLAAGEPGLERVRASVIDGIGKWHPNRHPRLIQDDRAAWDPTLRGYWEGHWTAGEECGLRLTFNEARRVAVIEVVHADSLGFSPQLTVRSYTVTGQPPGNVPREELLKVDRAAPVTRERFVLESRPLVSDLRFVVTDPAFLPGANRARLAEIIVWAEPLGAPQ